MQLLCQVNNFSARLLLDGGGRGRRTSGGSPHLLGLLRGRWNIVLSVLHNLKVANAIAQLPVVPAGDLLEAVQAHQTDQIDPIEIFVHEELGLLGLGAEGGGARRLRTGSGRNDKGRGRGGDEGEGGADGGLHFQFHRYGYHYVY